MMSSALKTRRKISAEAPLGLRTAATRTLVSSTKRILQAICLPEAPGASVLVARVRPWPLPRTPLCAGRCDERPSPESSPFVASRRRTGRSAAEQARTARAVQERRRAGEGLWAPGGGRAAWGAIAGLCPNPYAAAAYG